jgi:hypothetical protein
MLASGAPDRAARPWPDGAPFAAMDPKSAGLQGSRPDADIAQVQ